LLQFDDSMMKYLKYYTIAEMMLNIFIYQDG